MVLEKELEVLYLDQKEAGSEPHIRNCLSF